MLKSSAHQKPSTINPGTMFAARRINKALIINVNRPKDNRFIGKVKIIINGFKKVFIIPSTRATISAVTKSFICTPGNMYAVASTAKVLIVQLITLFIGLLFYFVLPFTSFIRNYLTLIN